MHVPCSETTADHPTIQVACDQSGNDPHLGFLGLLNGIVGAVPDGSFEGSGYIQAMFDEETGELMGFGCL